MCKRYKNWTETLAYQIVLMYRVGKEFGGDKFVERMKEEFFKIGRKSAERWLFETGVKPEECHDCLPLAKIQDHVDDRYANFWDGYVEHTPQAFEKEIKTCPITKPMSLEPDYCEILVSESYKGMLSALNPKFETEGRSKLLPKGDKCCRVRVTLKE
jgi:hypothetical protein